MEGSAQAGVTRGVVVRPDPAVTARVLDGRAVLLDARTSEMHTLNETATLIWNALTDMPLGHVCDDLAAAIGVPAERVWQDTAALVDELHGKGLVRLGR